MHEPTLKILGVYRPRISLRTWYQQWRVTGQYRSTQAHFARLVLIEAIAETPDGRVDMGKLGQMYKHWPNHPASMQVGYDEALLSDDGNAVVRRKMNCVYGFKPMRFAVYLHFYDPSRPLQWQHGEVMCPSIQKIPARLQRLVPYNACT